MDKNKIGKAIANAGSLMLGAGILGQFFVGGDAMKKLTIGGGVVWLGGSVVDVVITSLVKE